MKMKCMPKRRRERVKMKCMPERESEDEVHA